MKKVLFIIGTRPEAIKLYPVIKKCRVKKQFSTKICLTNQHTQLIHPLLEVFDLQADFELPHKACSDSLHEAVAWQLERLGKLFLEVKPDLVIVQGDTTSAFCGALAAHYAKIPIAHIEAGLRTDDLFAPWPEEAHRRLIDRLATYFFVPTLLAKETLLREGISQNAVWVVGNTSIDALYAAKERIGKSLASQKTSIAVTIHRRENRGEILEGIFLALRRLAHRASDVEISFFLHPAIQKEAMIGLSGVKNIHLQPPLDYLAFIEYILRSTFIITDSGGLQEEAPYLGKPLLIVRDTTERPEGIREGTARLIGTDPDQIVSHCMELLDNPALLAAMSKKHTPYGEGNSASQIVTLLEKILA